MSNKTNPETPVAAVPNPESTQSQESTEKPSFLAKTKQFVKTHKKPLIAGGVLTGLVGLAAVTGRNKASSDDYWEQHPLTEEEAEQLNEALAEVQNDTTVA